MVEVERVREDMESFSQAPVTDRILTNTTEVSKFNADFNLGKASGPNDVPNWAVGNLPRKAKIILTKVYITILEWQRYPAVWKHARLISLQNTSKDPTFPSSYRPISLLHTVGKFFEKVLLSCLNSEINPQGLLKDEQLGTA